MHKKITYRGARLYPPGTRGKNPYWLVRIRHNKRDVEWSTRMSTLDGARRSVDFNLEHILTKPPASNALYQPGALGRTWCARLLNGAQWRAKKNGLQCTLTVDDIVEIVRRANGCCEVTGLPFSDEGANNCRRAPYRPSLDRIDAGSGYTPENCRLVLFAVNTALSDWGWRVFWKIAQASVEKGRP